MEKKSIKTNTILNAIRMMLTVLVPFITFPYTSRIFLTEGNGKLNFANSVVQIFTLFASLGIYSYGVREGAKVRDSKRDFTQLAHELLFINGLSTIITYCLFVICIIFIPSLKRHMLLLVINGITIGFTALGLDWIYGVYEEYKYITIRQIITQIFIIAAMFLFIHNSEDIYLWALISSISGVGANIFNFIHARKYFTYKKIRTANYAVVRHILPIFILFSTQLASKVYSNIDMILLGVLSTDHHIGIYSASIKINTILITCFTAMSPVFMPRIVEYVKKNEKREYYIFLKKILRMIISLALPAVVGIQILSREIILLLAGNAFYDAAVTMRIISPIILITSCANILYYDVLIPHGKEKYVLGCTLLGAVINLIISCFVIPYWCENGAALGSLISEIISFGMAGIFCYKQDCKIIESIPNLFNYVLGTIYIVICCLVIKSITISNILILFSSILFGSIGYGVILLLRKDPIAEEGMEILEKLFCKIKKVISSGVEE